MRMVQEFQESLRYFRYLCLLVCLAERRAKIVRLQGSFQGYGRFLHLVSRVMERRIKRKVIFDVQDFF